MKQWGEFFLVLPSASVRYTTLPPPKEFSGVCRNGRGALRGLEPPPPPPIGKHLPTPLRHTSLPNTSYCTKHLVKFSAQGKDTNQESLASSMPCGGRLPWQLRPGSIYSSPFYRINYNETSDKGHSERGQTSQQRTS